MRLITAPRIPSPVVSCTIAAMTAAVLSIPCSDAAAADGKPAVARKPAVRVDHFGDPLPKGAVARLGSVRFRHELFGIADAVFSDDGKLIATRQRRKVYVWSAETGRQVAAFDRLIEVTALKFLPGGRILLIGVAAGGARSVYAADVLQNRMIGTFGFNGRPLSFAVSPKTRRLAVGYAGGVIEVWKFPSIKAVPEKPELSLSNLQFVGKQMSFSDDGDSLYAAGDYEVALITPKKWGRVVRRGSLSPLKLEHGRRDDHILWIAADPQKSSRVWVGTKARVVILDLGARTEELRYGFFTEHRHPILRKERRVDRTGLIQAASNPANGRVVLLGMRFTAEIDLKSGTCVRSPRLAPWMGLRYLGAFTLSPDGAYVAVADGVLLRIYDLKARRFLFESTYDVAVGAQDMDEPGRFSPNGDLYSWREFVWCTRTGRLLYDCGDDATSGFTSDNLPVVVSVDNGQVVLTDLSTGKTLLRHPKAEHEKRTVNGVVTPDGRDLLVRHRDPGEPARLSILDLTKGNLGRLRHHFESRLLSLEAAIHYSREHELCAVSRIIFRLGLKQLETDVVRCSAYRLGPDLRHMLVQWQEKGKIAVHELSRLRWMYHLDPKVREPDPPLARFRARHRLADSPQYYAFSPDERFLTRHAYGKLEIWETKTGKTIRTPDVLPSPLAACAFSEDGNLIAGASGETIVVYDRRKKAVVARYEDAGTLIFSLQFLPGDDRLAAGLANRTLLIYPL